MARKSISQIFKEIWPKLLIFTIMLAITIFQKHPMTFKAQGFSDAEIQEQFKTGEFKTTEFEQNQLSHVQLEKLLFTAIVFLIFFWFRRKNLKYDEEQNKKDEEIERIEQEKEEEEKKNKFKEFEFTDDDIEFYRKCHEKQKNIEKEKNQRKEKKLKNYEQNEKIKNLKAKQN